MGRYFQKKFGKKFFEIKSLSKNHDLFFQSNTFLLVDLFKIFRNKCIEIYELDHAHFHSGSGLAWQAALKKMEVELKLLTNTDMLLMVK